MKKKNKILYVDMDGVVADFDKGVQALEPGMIWDRENVDRVCEANPTVFRSLPDIEGGIEAVLKLKTRYEILFLSTPMWNVPQSYMDKRLWLQHKFGNWANKRLVLTHRKDLAIGDYLIDDRLTNGSENFKGEHIHYGQSPYENWEKVLNYLL